MARKIVVTVLLLVVLTMLGGAAFLFMHRKSTEENWTKVHVSEALIESDDFDNAIKNLLPVIQYGKRFEGADRALYLLAQSYEKGGYDEAKEVWKRLVDEFPESQYRVEGRLRLAQAMQTGDPAQARSIYEDLAKETNGLIRGRALLGVAQTYDAENDVEKARGLYYQMIDSATEFELVSKAKDRLTEINSERLWSPILDEFCELYTVQKGDAPVKIGQRYKTTAWFIEEANKVNRRNLRPGRRLKVPKEPFRVVVDKKNCRLDLVTDSGRFIKWYKVGVGEQSYKTPAGEYEIINKQVDPTWFRPQGGVIQPGDPENALGSRWMGIGSSLGIHGTNEPDTIGFQKSAGCIRMFNHEVEELYKLITYGTRITIIEGV